MLVALFTWSDLLLWQADLATPIRTSSVRFSTPKLSIGGLKSAMGTPGDGFIVQDVHAERV